MPRPHFIIKNQFQKRAELYEDILTDEILRDVCRQITGRNEYTVDFVDDGYNKGRLATLEYQGTTSYISFSEQEVKSRNSFFQSFPTALVKYYQNLDLNKRIYFYFLPTHGNIETPYFIFMYRLMKTAGTLFLNEPPRIAETATQFTSVQDIIAQRDLNRRRNRGNNSTYVTIDEKNTPQIFGKTYGANKYETTLLCLAIRNVTPYRIELYEIQEGTLRILPQEARDVIIGLGIRVIPSNRILEQQEFENNDSLRSPAFTYSLLEKLGEKKCALCACRIPQVIQGAHIWPVASIKATNNYNQDQKLRFAMDGDNGIWLCNNHHKLFNIDMILITEDGRVKYRSDIENDHETYIHYITADYRLRDNILTPQFLRYLNIRNGRLDEGRYNFFE